MKKAFIAILIIAALVSAVYFGQKYLKKYSDLDMLMYDIDSVKLNVPFNSIADVPATLGELLSLTIPVDINFLFQNHSESDFTVNSIYLELYTTDNDLIAYQDEVKDEFKVEAKKNNYALFSFNLYLTGLKKLIKQYDTTLLGSVSKLFNTYFTTKKFGFKVRLKGWVTAEGIKVVKIPIDKIIDI